MDIVIIIYDLLYMQNHGNNLYSYLLIWFIYELKWITMNVTEDILRASHWNNYLTALYFEID